jgi:hypothetical protein
VALHHQGYLGTLTLIDANMAVLFFFTISGF